MSRPRKCCCPRQGPLCAACRAYWREYQKNYNPQKWYAKRLLNPETALHVRVLVRDGQLVDPSAADLLVQKNAACAALTISHGRL